MNQPLVFNNIEANKKYFYVSKKAIPLNLVNVNNIIILKELKTIMRYLNILLVIYIMMV